MTRSRRLLPSRSQVATGLPKSSEFGRDENCELLPEPEEEPAIVRIAPMYTEFPSLYRTSSSSSERRNAPTRESAVSWLPRQLLPPGPALPILFPRKHLPRRGMRILSLGCGGVQEVPECAASP